MNQERVLIDTDMGNDDIMAISMLLLSRSYQITGYTLTDGVSRTTAGARNLNTLLNYFQKPSPIAIGPPRQFKSPINFPEIDIQRAEELTLLDGLRIQPESETPKLNTFDELVSESLSDSLTIFALGPLTNVAEMVNNYPQIKEKVSRIVMMGGGIDSGNVSPDNLAEYNIALDPQSADIVFKSEIPIVMVGIDATKSVPATPEFASKVRSLIPGTREGAVIRNIIINNDGDVNQFYDPLAAAILVDPGIITTSKRGYVSVLQTGPGAGKTILKSDTRGNTLVVFGANTKGFYRLTTDLIVRGGDNNG